MIFLKNEKFFKYFINLSILICICLSFLYIQLQNNNNYEINIVNSDTSEKQVLKFCNDYIQILDDHPIVEKQNISYTTSYRFIDAYPNINNLQCLGKIIEIWKSDITGEYHFLYGTNQKLYESINIIFNIFLLCFIIILYFSDAWKKLRILAAGLFVYFNYLLNMFFQIDNTFSSFVSDQSTLILITSSAFLFFQLFYKNNLLFILGIYFFIIFNYEYFGIYIVFSYILTKFDYQFTKTEKRFFNLLPFIFFVSRIITALSENFNLFWSRMFQSTYRGYSRFIDLQSDFLVLKCHTDMNSSHKINFIEVTNICEDTIGYGPIRKIIPLYGDVWISVIVAVIILFTLLLVQHRDLLNRYPRETIFITLVFMSPPLNLLIHLMNPDMFYLAFLYFVLRNYKKYPLIFSLIIYVFSLWKIHAVGILFGLLLLSLIKRDRSISKINIFFLFSTIVTYLIDVRTTEPLSIPASPDERMGFGILHDSIQLTKFTNFNNQNDIIFFLTLIILTVLIFSYFLNRRFDFDTIVGFKTYEIYGVAFWFFLSMIYQNQSYRLPLFIVLMVQVYKVSFPLVKFSVIFALFLNPVFISNYIFFEKLTLLTNRFGLYVVFSFLLIIFLKDFWVNLIQKNISNYKSNKNVEISNDQIDKKYV